MRYGRHLAQGHGLAWNPGGPPVEGYTNLAYVLLSAALVPLGADPVLAFKVLGLLGLAATAVITARLARRAEPGAAPWAAAVVLCSPGLAFWSVAGLETAPAAALLTFAVLRFEDGTARSDAAAAGALGLLALLRAEAPVWAVALAAARAGMMAVEGLRAGRWRLPGPAAAWLARTLGITEGDGDPPGVAAALRAAARRLAPWLWLGAALGALQLWRTLYFGVSLPNPVLFKSTLSVEGAGHSVLEPFVQTWWPVLAVAAVGAIRARRWLWGALVALAVPLFATATTSAHGSSTVAFYDRYLLPVVPLVAVLAALGLHQLGRWRRWARAPVGVALLAWESFNPVVNVVEVGSLAISHRDNVRPATTALASFIATQRPPSYRLALGDVGFVGARLPNVIDDVYGLNDYTYTLQCRGNLDVWVEALLSRMPDGVVMVMRDDDGPAHAAHAVDQRLARHPTFQARYHRVRDFTAGTNPWKYVLFER